MGLNRILDDMTKKWVKTFSELGFLAILLSVLIHYAGNIILLFTYEEVVIYEPSKMILGVEFFFDIIAMIYVTYRIVKTAKI